MKNQRWIKLQLSTSAAKEIQNCAKKFKILPGINSKKSWKSLQCQRDSNSVQNIQNKWQKVWKIVQNIFIINKEKKQILKIQLEERETE